MINVIFESDFKHEDICIKVMGSKFERSLKVIDGDVKNIQHEVSQLRVTILQVLCLEKLYAQEAKYEGMEVDILDRKKNWDFGFTDVFQDSNWF